MNDEDNPFERITAGVFGPVEGQMGQDLYQAQVKQGNSNAELLAAQVALTRAQTDVLGKQRRLSEENVALTQALTLRMVAYSRLVSLLNGFLVIWMITLLVWFWRSVILSG